MRADDRLLLTLWRTGCLGFVTFGFREVVYLGGLGALNGRIDGQRAFIVGHGAEREVAPWFHALLSGYERTALAWFMVGMVAVVVLHVKLWRRGDPPPLF